MIHQLTIPGARILQSQCSAAASYDVCMSTATQHCTAVKLQLLIDSEIVLSEKI